MAVGACVGLFGYWIYLCVNWLPYPFQLDYGEGYNLYFAHLWTNGWSWDITQEPYLTMIYGPVYLGILGSLAEWFGMEFLPARIVMAAATGVSCLFVGLIAYRIGKSRLIAVVAGLLPLGHPIIRSWSIQTRADPLAVMFSIIGVWIAVRFKDSKWFWLAPLFFAISFYTKINVIGIVAVGVFLLWGKEWKKLAGFAGLTGGLILVPMAIYPQMFHHLVTYNGMQFWEHLIQLTMPINIFLIPLVGLLILALYYVKKNGISEVALWMAASIVICSVFLLKKGSSTNYYIEAIYAICLAGALGFPYVVERVREKLRWKYAAFAVAGVMLLPLVANKSPLAFPFPGEGHSEAMATVQAMIADTNEPIPTENAGVVVRAGKKLLIEPMLFTYMANAGVWNESGYVRDLGEQRFDYIVLRGTIEEHLEDVNGHFTAAASQAIYGNYSLVYEYMDESGWWYIVRVYEANRRLDL